LIIVDLWSALLASDKALVVSVAIYDFV
jgi:hypothetical protein